MTYGDLERAAAIYVPLAGALLGGWLRGGMRRRQFAGCLLSVLWTAPALLVLQRWNWYAGWWSFVPGSAFALRGMPGELYVGWVLLWGVVPQLASPRLGIGWLAGLMAGLDCVAMPLLGLTVTLHGGWLAGEAVAVAIVLLPALCLGRWTSEGTHLRGRAALQMGAAGLLFLFFLPEVIFAFRPGRGWMPMVELPGWAVQVAAQVVFLLALPGIAAVFEFAERGRGTPIPYDPPERLVTSGVYRYCANPMQVSCAAVMLAWAGLLRSGWMAGAAVVAVVYSAGLARWDEEDDLERRFGDAWRRYRAEVKSWRWRATPYCGGPVSRIFLARGCGPCREVRGWLERRRLTGLVIVDAETLPAGSIRRVRYVAGDGSEAVEGVRAVGRALEHLTVGWALVGAGMRLPVVWRVVQVLLDASGLGPREIGGETRVK